MHAMLSTVATLQQQQQQEQQHHQQVELPVELNSSEMFQNVQHDWNFGGIKLLAPPPTQATENSVGRLQQQVDQHLNHEDIQLMDVVHEPEEEEEVIDDMVECHNLLDNDEEEDGDEIVDEDDEDVVECIDAEQQEQDELMNEMVEHVMDVSGGDAVQDIVDKLQQQQQQQHQQQQLQAQLQDVVQLTQHSFMTQGHSSDFANEVSHQNKHPIVVTM